MSSRILDGLWESVARLGQVFSRGMLTSRPAGVRRYLGHAIGENVALASAVLM